MPKLNWTGIKHSSEQKSTSFIYFLAWFYLKTNFPCSSLNLCMCLQENSCNIVINVVVKILPCIHARVLLLVLFFLRCLIVTCFVGCKCKYIIATLGGTVSSWRENFSTKSTSWTRNSSYLNWKWELFMGFKGYLLKLKHLRNWSCGWRVVSYEICLKFLYLHLIGILYSKHSCFTNYTKNIVRQWWW